MYRLLCIILLAMFSNKLWAQIADTVGNKIVTLSEVVVGKNIDVEEFIKTIQQDTSFYKSFRTLHLLNYEARNDIRMFGKKNKTLASLKSHTRQTRKTNCRQMEVVSETATGNFYNNDGFYNYYTATLYASLFFTNGIVCNEDNIVGNRIFDASNKSGIEKRKEQLRTLFFNPGGKISGLPFISGKTEIFSDKLVEYYDMKLDYEIHGGVECYVFTQQVLPGKEDKVVINNIKTWFDANTKEVVARTYSLSYDAFLYDFDVQMEVEMQKVSDIYVPALIRYTGNWKVPSQKRERGIFTATLSNFSF